MITKINTGGIQHLEPLAGSDVWYWGTDYTSGDLYEAEDLYRDGHPIKQNRLIFVRRADGEVLEPLKAKEGQYFGVPVFDSDSIVILLADFPAREINLFRYDDAGTLSPIVVIPRDAVEDCYNLMPRISPLMVTRQTAARFQIIWPVKADFAIHPAESFCFRDGDLMYFSRWYEDPDYREETVVRKYPAGEIVGQMRGSLNEMPDGQLWLLTE